MFFLCQNCVCRGRFSRNWHWKYQNWLKITIFMTFLKFQKFWFFFSKMYRELRENIQVLKTGPLESNENWHVAVKWWVMIKCKRCILFKNILGRRYIIFFVWRGGLKMCFLDFINFCVILVPWWSGMRQSCVRRVFRWKRPCVDIFFQFQEILKNNKKK